MGSGFVELTADESAITVVASKRGIASTSAPTETLRDFSMGLFLDTICDDVKLSVAGSMSVLVGPGILSGQFITSAVEINF